MALRRLLSTSALILLCIGLALAASGVLFTFPEDVRVWNAATWTLVGTLLALAVLVAASGVKLARIPAARRWPRILAFALGLACLALVAVGLL